MFLKYDPYSVWCSIFYSKLINCFVKGRGACGSGDRNVKILKDFRKSPRFSLTSPLSQLREKSSRPVFTICGEPWPISLCMGVTNWPNIFVDQGQFIDPDFISGTHQRENVQFADKSIYNPPRRWCNDWHTVIFCGFRSCKRK